MESMYYTNDSDFFCLVIMFNWTDLVPQTKRVFAN